MRHRYEAGGPKGKCRWCQLVYSNPVHRQSRDAIHSPLASVTRLVEVMRYTAIPTIAVFAEDNGGARDALHECRKALEGFDV